MADGTTAKYHLSEEDRQKAQRETRENAVERVASSTTRSADAGDASIGWTAQQGGAAPVNGGDTRQKFAPWQLPNPEAAKAAGLPVLDVPEDLVLEDDVAVLAAHPNGPEPSEIAARQATINVAEEPTPGAAARATGDPTDGPVSGSGDATDDNNDGGSNDEVEQPAASASKGEWVDYAKTQGYNEDDGLTKDQLVEKYGS